MIGLMVLPKGQSMFKTIMDLLREETAATAIECGLIAALVSVAAVTVLSTVGNNLTVRSRPWHGNSRAQEEVSTA
jgi:Flp pilus assembly pilin Flp